MTAQLLTILVFIFWLGACVGSFLNVVVFRLPEDRSLVWPPSHCPNCQSQLRWWENVPIFAWLYLRGRCRTCRMKISPQYPLIEALTAVLFVALYCVYYMPQLNAATGHEPFMAGSAWTWPVYAVHLALIATLIAATVIDAKLYIIPLQLPWTATLIALIVLPIYGQWQPQRVISADPITPTAMNFGVIHAAIGGAAGLAVALMLLMLGILPRSFDDEEMYELEQRTMDQLTGRKTGEPVEPIPADDHPDQSLSHEDQTDDHPDQNQSTSDDEQADDAADNPAELFLAYSHPRREVLKELLFVAFPILGTVLAVLYMRDLIHPGVSPDAVYPVWVRVLAGSVFGYLVGGGFVWLTRIFGTLGFGREAMGLGDVHMLASIGAVLGWKASVVTFFIAPFLGLGFVAIAAGVSRIVRGQVRVIPYGPYLATAAVLVMLLGDLLTKRLPLF